MRLTSEQILEEYFQLMEIDRSIVPTEISKCFLEIIKAARKEEPRINSGAHYIDWMNICDEDDDFDSFYGKDYFND